MQAPSALQAFFPSNFHASFATPNHELVEAASHLRRDKNEVASRFIRSQLPSLHCNSSRLKWEAGICRVASCGWLERVTATLRVACPSILSPTDSDSDIDF